MLVKKVLARPEGCFDRFDCFKWAVLALLVILAIGFDICYKDLSWSLTALFWIAWALVCVPLLLVTNRGRCWVEAARLAWLELRKVSWPVRDEVVKTTVMVSVCVIFVAVALWGMDAFFAMIVKWLSN